MEKIIEFKKKIKSEIVTGPQIPKKKINIIRSFQNHLTIFKS
ncbi:MAG: hypothetical protein CM15mP14_1820 [Rhodospirillaceae bacterium]|nr:MAG: hypothetical protein CM15mP14_1820 [Rhodospirillaceae bacterium]